jgi:hypothetical protein
MDYVISYAICAGAVCSSIVESIKNYICEKLVTEAEESSETPRKRNVQF